jgi:hypothetical protein
MLSPGIILFGGFPKPLPRFEQISGHAFAHVVAPRPGLTCCLIETNDARLQNWRNKRGNCLGTPWAIA